MREIRKEREIRELMVKRNIEDGDRIDREEDGDQAMENKGMNLIKLKLHFSSNADNRGNAPSQEELWLHPSSSIEEYHSL